MSPLRRLWKLRERVAATAGAGRFLRMMLAVAGICFLAALLAIGRIAWALAHASIWVNYRGDVLSRSQMLTALGLSALVAACSIGIVLVLSAALRNPRH